MNTNFSEMMISRNKLLKVCDLLHYLLLSQAIFTLKSLSALKTVTANMILFVYLHFYAELKTNHYPQHTAVVKLEPKMVDLLQH